MTDGQATTCMLAIPYCNLNDAIVVYNIDTYVEPGEMKYEDISEMDISHASMQKVTTGVLQNLTMLEKS